ncbi:putative RING finger protein C4G3.12c, partial [Frankliniella fusca]
VMDSAEQHDEAAKALVRSKRLQRFGEGVTGEVPAAVEEERYQRQHDYPADDIGAPVASSTLLSPAGTTSPTATSAEPHTTPTGSSDSTAVLIVNGNGIKELLQSIQTLLSERRLQPTQSSATASSTSRDTAVSSERRDAAGPSSAHPAGRKPLQGFADTSEVVVVCSDSSASGTDGSHEQVRGGQSRAPLLTNWKQTLPSTSSAGFGDENKLPTALSNKRRPGRPKGSKNKRVISSDSESAQDDPAEVSDSETQGRNPKRFKSKPPPKCNWRESLPSTSSAGFGTQSNPAPCKKRPGRPKGSKNKSKAQVSCSSESSSLVCHICREGHGGGAFCLTDCGHLFHKRCLDRWILTSNQKYRTEKTCPYCGGKFGNTVPFFG